MDGSITHTPETDKRWFSCCAFMWFTNLKCFRVESQPQSVSIVPGAQRVPHDFYVFKVREVRVLLKRRTLNYKGILETVETFQQCCQIYSCQLILRDEPMPGCSVLRVRFITPTYASSRLLSSQKSFPLCHHDGSSTPLNAPRGGFWRSLGGNTSVSYAHVFHWTATPLWLNVFIDRSADLTIKLL